MAYDPDELAEQLGSNGNGNGHKDLTKVQFQRLLGQVPPKFRGRIKKQEVEGKRSTYIYRLEAELIEAGIDRETIISVLMNAPVVKDKYEGRDIRAELARDLDNCIANGVRADLASGRKPKKKKEEPQEEAESELVFADSKKMEETFWLWDKLIPLGEMTALAGRQGNGKSQLTCWLASQVTTGGLGRAPANVIFASLEDSVTKTIVPRLRAANADTDRVKIISAVSRDGERDVLRLPQDVGLIAHAAKQYKAELVVIDPLSAALSAGAQFDSHRDTDVRRALAPIYQVAGEEQLAFLFVIHMKKKAEEEAMNGVMGSVAFTAAPRSVLVLGYDTVDGSSEDDRVLVQVKTNLDKHQEPRAFQIRPTSLRGGKIRTSRIIPQGLSRLDAGEVSLSPGKSTSKTEIARTLLQQECTGKKVEYNKLLDKAQELGVSASTLKRAKKATGVKVIPPTGPGTSSKWTIL